MLSKNRTQTLWAVADGKYFKYLAEIPKKNRSRTLENIRGNWYLKYLPSSMVPNGRKWFLLVI